MFSRSLVSKTQVIIRCMRRRIPSYILFVGQVRNVKRPICMHKANKDRLCYSLYCTKMQFTLSFNNSIDWFLFMYVYLFQTQLLYNQEHAKSWFELGYHYYKKYLNQLSTTFSNIWTTLKAPEPAVLNEHNKLMEQTVKCFHMYTSMHPLLTTHNTKIK